VFSDDPHWERFWAIMEYRDQKDLTFAEAEEKIRTELTALLNGELAVSSENSANSNENSITGGEGVSEHTAEIAATGDDSSTTTTTTAVAESSGEVQQQESAGESVHSPEEDLKAESVSVSVAVVVEEVQTRAENPSGEVEAVANDETTRATEEGGEKVAIESQLTVESPQTGNEDALATSGVAESGMSDSGATTEATTTSTIATDTPVEVASSSTQTSEASAAEVVALVNLSELGNEAVGGGELEIGEEFGEELRVNFDDVQCDD
jgi:hypothetical protein